MANGGGSNPNSSHLDLDCGGRLSVPMRPECGIEQNSPGYHRRRKLSTASKVSYIFKAGLWVTENSEIDIYRYCITHWVYKLPIPAIAY